MKTSIPSLIPIYLNNFQVIKPPHKMNQQHLTDWISQCHVLAEKNRIENSKNENVDEALDLDMIKKLFQRYAVKENLISNRYFENEDVLSHEFDKMKLYNVLKSEAYGSDIYDRTQFFSEKSEKVINQFYENPIYKPDHIIHVTCTGYISPSAPQKLVADEKWQKATEITHAYHMGCYAALPAIRMANSLVKSSDSTDFTTDIVHTEMCGLHMNPLAHTPEQMVVQTLFADGHIKYTATKKLNGQEKNLKILATHERLLPNSSQDMSWIPSAWGMQMNLSREVPIKIKDQLKIFFQELLAKTDMNLEEAMISQFAVHPGGPKIIDSVQEVLELSNLQIAHSKKVLFERGNMSSATLPHVWDLMLKDENIIRGTKIISFAFGPGLTLFGSIFEVC